jgi:hypothetical protein
MIVCRRDVCPSSASQCSEDANSSDKLGKCGVWAARQDVPEANECETRTRCEGDEEHEDGSFRVPIPNGGRDRRKPFFWITCNLILYDFVVM